jgi:hypothetical protein
MSSQYGSISWNGGALWSSNGYLATNVEKSMEINLRLGAQDLQYPDFHFGFWKS